MPLKLKDGMKRLILLYMTFFYLIIFSACNKKGQMCVMLSGIDSLADVKPDSVEAFFSQLSLRKEHFTPEENAFYSLVKTKVDFIKKKEGGSDINTAIEYYEKNRKNRCLAYAYFYKAEAYMLNQSDSLAVLYMLKALDKAQSSANLHLMVKIRTSLGSIDLFHNLPENALQEFKRAYRLVDSLPDDTYYKPLLLRNIARAFNLKKILDNDNNGPCVDTAVQYYNKALKLIGNGKQSEMARSIYQELSTIYIYQKDFPKAFRYLEMSKDTGNMSRYYSKKANLFMNMGKLDSAYYYTKECSSGQGIYSKYSMYDRLFQIERRRGNLLKALAYVDTLLVLNDSLIVHTIPHKIVNIQKKYDEEKLRAEKAILQVKYEKEKSRSLRTFFIIIVLLFLSTYLYIYSYLKKKKLQEALLKQKNELLLLNQKVQSLDLEIKRSLTQIQQLEKEKERIGADLNIMSKEKGILLQEKELELEQCRIERDKMCLQRSKYEDLCLVEFKKLFLSSPLSRRIPAFNTDKVITGKLDEHVQTQLIAIMDEICCNFASRLSTLLKGSTEKICLCCLIRLQVKPRYIMVLCDLSKEAYYKQCQRIAETIIGKGSASALKDYLKNF